MKIKLLTFYINEDHTDKRTLCKDCLWKQLMDSEFRFPASVWGDVDLSAEQAIEL